jgi:hypothetical protein
VIVFVCDSPDFKWMILFLFLFLKQKELTVSSDTRIEIKRQEFWPLLFDSYTKLLNQFKDLKKIKIPTCCF